jgi:hypothetical protein
VWKNWILCRHWIACEANRTWWLSADEVLTTSYGELRFKKIWSKEGKPFRLLGNVAFTRVLCKCMGAMKTQGKRGEFRFYGFWKIHFPGLRIWFINGEVLSIFRTGVIKVKRNCDNVYVIKATVHKKGLCLLVVVNYESVSDSNNTNFLWFKVIR